VWVESGGPKHFLTSASFECTAQRQSFPRPKLCRMCRLFKHICRHLKLGIWSWVWETVRTLPTLRTFFPKLPSTHQLNFDPKSTMRTRKNISYPMVCSGQETVWWLQSYALRGFFGQVCLRKG